MEHKSCSFFVTSPIDPLCCGSPGPLVKDPLVRVPGGGVCWDLLMSSPPSFSWTLLWKPSRPSVQTGGLSAALEPKAPSCVGRESPAPRAGSAHTWIPGVGSGFLLAARCTPPPRGPFPVPEGSVRCILQSAGPHLSCPGLAARPTFHLRPVDDVLPDDWVCRSYSYKLSRVESSS